MVQISTNEVFDGRIDRPYNEDDAPNPINPYGASKLLGEKLTRERNPRHLIVRTAWLFGAGVSNFPAKIRAAASRMLAEGQPLRVVGDEWGNPTDVRWLAPSIRELTKLAEQPGVYHLAGEPATTREAWARLLLQESGVVITPIALSDYVRASRTPPRAVLSTAKAQAIGIVPFDWRTTV
jgi:dTDP-4-dehydrorhamnose reductase